MTTEKAIEQLQDLIKDRQSLMSLTSGGSCDNVFKNDIEALQQGIRALKTAVFTLGEIQEITIKGKLPSLNDYIAACRSSRYEGAQKKRETEDLIIIQLARLKPITSPVVIHFEWSEKTRRRDKDNVAFAKKFILDALQKSGKLINDNNKYIAGFTDRFTYGGDYGVTIRIERVEE